MKKSITKLSLITLMVTASSAAVADDSFDFSVIGNITPAACKATISGGNVFDYGNILSNSLNKDDFTILEQKDTGFTIVCDAPAKLALKTVDNRMGTKNNPIGQVLVGSAPLQANTGTMGLGLDPAGNKIGAYLAAIPTDTVTLDTADNVDSINSDDKGATWRKVPRIFMTTASPLYTWAKTGELVPQAFSTMTGTLQVQAAISPASTLDLTQPVKLDGSATVQLFYL
ncbi:hypothetical protein ED28_07890 [[Pantoea] beijingensis]|uniref:DUF1120 domain-containing protein n=1 Tax=[Pantoea] beijingensis TaxID=1324864 RepID=A0A443IDL6_9GAMM|nr:DUF1120 domain-containing protein [[Pantoea] beijingensis]RWR02292.1 hypothetical protein ED28_07890 [[Pantoea] beijingensis]